MEEGGDRPGGVEQVERDHGQHQPRGVGPAADTKLGSSNIASMAENL
jgi:hypothetical protein